MKSQNNLALFFVLACSVIVFNDNKKWLYLLPSEICVG